MRFFDSFSFFSLDFLSFGRGGLAGNRGGEVFLDFASPSPDFSLGPLSPVEVLPVRVLYELG
jgi:hypothetical protein